jgi:hypothetical protein
VTDSSGEAGGDALGGRIREALHYLAGHGPVSQAEYVGPAEVELDSLLARLEAAERRVNGPHVYSKAGPGDFIGHDGWECDEDCDACYFAHRAEAAERENERLKVELEQLRGEK